MKAASKMTTKQISDELDAIAGLWRDWHAGLTTPDMAVAERMDELEEELLRRRLAGIAA
jgi:hypothetical protein